MYADATGGAASHSYNHSHSHSHITDLEFDLADPQVGAALLLEVPDMKESKIR